MKKQKKYSEDFRCAPPCDALLAKYDPSSDYFIEIKCHQRSCKEVRYTGNHQPAELIEFRCYAVDPKKSERAGEEVVCNKLLARISPGTKLEIRCPRCRSFVSSDNTPKGE